MPLAMLLCARVLYLSDSSPSPFNCHLDRWFTYRYIAASRPLHADVFKQFRLKQFRKHFDTLV